MSHRGHTSVEIPTFQCPLMALDWKDDVHDVTCILMNRPAVGGGGGWGGGGGRVGKMEGGSPTIWETLNTGGVGRTWENTPSGEFIYLFIFFKAKEMLMSSVTFQSPS